ncbi:MAG: SNF2 helicase associated domain-containing protein, partial [Defluviitaleaceae bacterium]|nr:SNF2 helicase associated domain-containing protein [Defluviitaleaceae bacterium]
MNNITKGTILSVSSNADVFARGERYYREGKLLSVQSEAQGDAIIIRATVEGNYKHYDVELWLDAQNNLIKYSCNCESHNIWRGACKHVVTAMFSLSEGNFNTQKTSGLQKNVKTLTDSIEKLILKEIDEGLIITQAPAEPVRLAPCFHYEKFAEAHVTFAVGYKRMYVIKNIEAFVTSVNKEETVKYGNGLSFCHHINSFDSQSRRIIKFLQNEEEAFRDFIKRVQKNYSSVYGTSASSSRSLTLTERNLDDFFELFDGETIDGEIDGSVKIKFETKTPEFKLNVRCTENQAAVSATPFNLRVLNGRLFQYYVSKESICRMKKNDGLILLQMVKALADARGAEILFTENERSRFFSVILPKFRGLGIVASIEGEEPDVAACQVQTKLFFDSENKNVICRCVFHYGENEINPLESAGYGFLRDSAEEYRITRMLTFYGFAPEYEKQIYKLISNDAIYGFLKEGIEHLKKYAEIYVTDALKAKTIKSQYGSVGIRLQGELLNIELDDSDFTLSELIEAMESYQAKKKYHRLKDGRFLNLESEHVQSVAELLSAMDVTKKEISGNGLNLPAYRALYLDGLVKESGASGLFSFDTQLGNLIGCFNENSKLAFDIPPVLVPVLREYQKTGYQWLKMLAHYGFGGILAGDMGRGKTVQVIAVLLSGQKRGAKSLVVVPTSLLYNWQNEIQKFA